eukprot:sb/3476104/
MRVLLVLSWLPVFYLSYILLWKYTVGVVGQEIVHRCGDVNFLLWWGTSKKLSQGLSNQSVSFILVMARLANLSYIYVDNDFNISVYRDSIRERAHSYIHDLTIATGGREYSGGVTNSSFP